MIPYIEIPSLHLFGPFSIHAFGVLVACAIWVGTAVQKIRARQLQLDQTAVAALATWVVLFGFVISHIFDVVAYEPRRLLSDPLFLFRNFNISSFGGLLGAVVGLVLWQRRYQKPILPYADATVFGFVFAWFIGRLGCASAHDHPGRHTDFFLAVRYPDGPRHDLGLEEALLTLPLCIALAIAFRTPRRPGVYIAAACLYYAPVRFLLDSLRATDVVHPDARYLGMTPGQYAALVMFGYGLWLLGRLLKPPAGTIAASAAVSSESRP